MSDASPAAAATPPTDPTKPEIVSDWTHASPLVSCRFDPAGRFVFAGAQDNSVQRWDLASGAVVPLVAHESWVHALGFANHGETLLTGGCDGQLIVWPTAAEKPAPERRIAAHQGWIRALAVSPDETLVATAGNDLIVRLWRLSDGSLERELPGHAKHVYSVMFHPSGQFLLSGDLAGAIVQWDLAAGKELRRFDAAPLWSYNGGQAVDFGGVRTLALNPAGNRLLGGGLHEASNPLGAVHEPLLVEFEWESGKALPTHTTKEKLKGVVWRAMYHRDGYIVAGMGGSSGGYLLFWKPDEATEFSAFKLPHLTRDLDLHADGRRLATAHFDGHLRVTRL